jgi:predicted DNA-binding transcriptional regulator AlpA
MNPDDARESSNKAQLEFWRLKRVCEVTGLSKSEVYRRVAAGQFPPPHKYPGSGMNFWPSVDVQSWMLKILGEQFESLLGRGE